MMLLDNNNYNNQTHTYIHTTLTPTLTHTHTHTHVAHVLSLVPVAAHRIMRKSNLFLPAKQSVS